MIPASCHMAQQNLQADLLRLQAEGWAVSIEVSTVLLCLTFHIVITSFFDKDLLAPG